MKLLSTKTLSILLASTVLVNSGCATIFGRSNYKVTINSNPPGSTITVTDKKGIAIYQGATPATIKLKSSAGYFSKGQYQVKFHLNGYDEKVVTVSGTLNGWYIGNILIGGVIGMLIIDPASGAMYKIADTDINETLQKAATAQLEIRDINSIPKQELKNLEKIN